MSATAPALQWLRTGQEIFPAMLAAIHAARESVRLETYICTDGKIGRQFRDALMSAAQRGVRVSMLVDALGSWLLSDTFFLPLLAAGGNVRRFNPLHEGMLLVHVENKDARSAEFEVVGHRAA